MGLRISTNLAAINAQRQLGKQQMRSEHALAALSSGSRIVKASDDAAGLTIAENIKGQVRGLKMARMNAYNAQSLIQTSEVGLSEISNVFGRIRELGVQAASDNISNDERAFLDTEAQQLLTEADRIAKTTQFGTKKLLDGSGEKLEFHVGPFGNTDENVISYTINANATKGGALDYSGISLKDKDGARGALGKMDKATVELGKMRADFGAVQSRLETTVSNLDIQYENLSAAHSRIRDADVAYETAELASSSVLQNAAVGVMAQANALPQQALRLLQ